MAILRSAQGQFYDVDDNILEGKQVKPEDLPKELQGGGSPPPGGGGGGGGGGLAGLIQVIVNVPGGGGGGGGAPAPGAGEGKAGEEDVAGHGHCGPGGWWRNYWRNCWRNCWRNYNWANFGW